MTLYTKQKQPHRHRRDKILPCDNMDGTWGYYAKWNKSDRERQIYDITYRWNLKKWYKWTYLQNSLTDFKKKHGYKRVKMGGVIN